MCSDAFPVGDREVLRVLQRDGRMAAGTSAFAARALTVEVLVWIAMRSCTDGKLELGAEG